MEFSVVIPCYSSGAWLETLVKRIMAVVDARCEPFEIILVNDASPDNTWSAIRSLADRYRCVRGLDLLSNTGQYRSTLCGLEHARGKFIITMDDDLQHPPEEIPKLVEAIMAGGDCDCVIASFRSKRHSVLRNFGSLVMGRVFQTLYGKPAAVQATGFRIMRRVIAQALCAHGAVNPNVNALLFQTTRRIANVEVEHHPRAGGRSGYGLLRLARIAADNVLSVSTLPLKCVSLLGLAAAAGGMLLGVFYLVRYLLGFIGAPGFATLVLLILFFGGMTLFSVGLLGEYVIRIMEEVKRRPRYFVREQVGCDAKPQPTSQCEPEGRTG